MSASVTREILFVVAAVILDPAAVLQGDGEIVVHRLVVEEVLLDHVAAIAQAEDEVAEAVVGVDLHDVPEDRPPADLDHRLGPELGLLSQPGSDATAQDHDFHWTHP